MKTFVSIVFAVSAVTLFLLVCETSATSLRRRLISQIEPTTVKIPPNSTLSGDSDDGDLCTENINNDNITHFKWYRFHNESQRCYHIDERGPCGELMLFYRIGDTPYGDCDCNFYYKCNRPLIYHEPKHRCYFVNDQGPCEEKDEWFVFGDDFLPTCQTNPCLTEQANAPSTPNEFWFERLGECYRTNTIGYCEHADEILSVKWNEYYPTCNRRMTCKNSRSESVNSSNNATDSNCLPGQRRDLNGSCKKVVVIT